MHTRGGICSSGNFSGIENVNYCARGRSYQSQNVIWRPGDRTLESTRQVVDYEWGKNKSQSLVANNHVNISDKQLQGTLFGEFHEKIESISRLHGWGWDWLAKMLESERWKISIIDSAGIEVTLAYFKIVGLGLEWPELIQVWQRLIAQWW